MELPEIIVDKENIDSNFYNTDGTFNRKSFEKFKIQTNNQKNIGESLQSSESFYEMQGFGMHN